VDDAFEFPRRADDEGLPPERRRGPVRRVLVLVHEDVRSVLSPEYTTPWERGR